MTSSTALWGTTGLLLCVGSLAITMKGGGDGQVVVVELGEPIVVLDCPYTVDEHDTLGFVVMWWWSELAIYKWVPMQRTGPQATRAWQHAIDTSYEATNTNLTRYSSLRILEPTAEMNGVFTCLVSSYFSEIRREMRLVVYSLSDVHLTLVEQTDAAVKSATYLVERGNVTSEERSGSVTDEDGATHDNQTVDVIENVFYATVTEDENKVTVVEAKTGGTVSEEEDEPNNMTVRCVTGPTNPEPRLQLFLARGDERQELAVHLEVTYFDDKYEVDVEASLSPVEAEGVVLQCVMSIPYTNLTLTDNLSTAVEVKEVEEVEVETKKSDGMWMEQSSKMLDWVRGSLVLPFVLLLACLILTSVIIMSYFCNNKYVYVAKKQIKLYFLGRSIDVFK